MIQIDMEMPSCCYDCDFSIGVMSTKADRECTITDKYVNDDDKPEWCPLIKVPDNNVGNISEFPNNSTDCISRQAAIDAIHGRIFQEIVVEYPSYNTYTEYKGKPYFSIKYTENGQEFIGYGTYKPEVLSEYLKEYFMPSVQPEQKKDEWISCKKKPPEDFEWVYTQTIYGEHIVTRYIPPKIKPESHPHGYWGDTDCFEYDYFDVVAWRHLPEPYRGEQE